MLTTICVAVVVVGTSAASAPKATVAPLTKLLPLIVSGKVAPPASVLAGKSEARVGCALLFVSEKLAAVATPATFAVTVYGPPAVPLAVNTAAVATPLALVVAVFTPPANPPLAPLAGAVNVTMAPLTRLFPASLTVACSCVENAVLMVVVCGVPAVAVMLAGGPGLLVNEKLAALATPDTFAVTV